MRKTDKCDGCQLPLGAARLVVHDPKGKSGVFHVSCYHAAAPKPEDVVSIQRLHADAETLCGVE